MFAPDQLAWEIILTEALSNAEIRYDQLIHYPHEGGTILVSVFSLIVKLFGGKNSLTITAILLDTISRGIQLIVVRKYFSRSVFLFFGIWTILSIPAIIPWSVVNYGLHSLVSFVPFVFLLFIDKTIKWAQNPWFIGVSLGLLMWISYSNVVFIAIYILYQLVKTNWKFIIRVSIALAGILIIHLLIRTNLDPGFHISQFTTTEIRGLSYDYLKELGTYKRLYQVFIEALPGSSMLSETFQLSVTSIRSIWNTINLIGAMGIAILLIRSQNHFILWPLVLVLAFILVYAISPFYDPHIDRENFVYARHLTYILPIFCLMVLFGLNQIRHGWVLVTLYIFLSSSSTIALLIEEPKDEIDMSETGWVLGTKLGHDVGRLIKISNNYPEYREDLIEGYGWAIASGWLAQGNNKALEEQIRSTIINIPTEDRIYFGNGIERALCDLTESNDVFHCIQTILADEK